MTDMDNKVLVNVAPVSAEDKVIITGEDSGGCI